MLSRGRLGDAGRVPLFGDAGRVDVGEGGELMACGGGTGGEMGGWGGGRGGARSRYGGQRPRRLRPAAWAVEPCLKIFGKPSFDRGSS
jgi:hypothetical protein